MRFCLGESKASIWLTVIDKFICRWKPNPYARGLVMVAMEGSDIVTEPIRKSSM